MLAILHKHSEEHVGRSGNEWLTVRVKSQGFLGKRLGVRPPS
jgi:hypothetical protein